MESQQISPNEAKNGVCVLSKVKNGPKGHNGSKRAEIYEKKGFLDQKYLFSAQFFFSGSLRTPLPPKQEIGLPNKISGIGGCHLHLEKSGEFLNNPEN